LSWDKTFHLLGKQCTEQEFRTTTQLRYLDIRLIKKLLCLGIKHFIYWVNNVRNRSSVLLRNLRYLDIRLIKKLLCLGIKHFIYWVNNVRNRSSVLLRNYVI
jgi:hypothetical protein